MSRHLNHPTITLPLFIAYSDILLPTLLLEAQQQSSAPASITQNPPPSTSLLWVVEDSDEAKKLHRKLTQQPKRDVNTPNSLNTPNILNTSKTLNHKTDRQSEAKKEANPLFEISTLAQIDRQNVRQRYELACFWLPTLRQEQLQRFIPTIMRYRDLYAAHLLIAISTDVDLRAYGFTPFDILAEQTFRSACANTKDTLRAAVADPAMTLWQFNLYDYKRLPDWLNNKYWANPENWDKHRW